MRATSCKAASCTFTASYDEAETWEFRAVVVRGKKVLASSLYVKVVWCVCNVEKRLYVNVVYHMDEYRPRLVADCGRHRQSVRSGLARA